MPKPLCKALKIGDHISYLYKGHRSYGIVEEFCSGPFGEPRVKVRWVLGRGSRFSVCLEDLTPDTFEIVRYTLETTSAQADKHQTCKP